MAESAIEMTPVLQIKTLKLESVALADARWAGCCWRRDPNPLTRPDAHLAIANR
jgi:hypothetical protein